MPPPNRSVSRPVRPGWPTSLVLALCLGAAIAGFALARLMSPPLAPLPGARRAVSTPAPLAAAASRVDARRAGPEIARPVVASANSRSSLDALTACARIDPAAAMARAQAEPNRHRRLQARDAVLRGWAAVDAAAAGEWALGQRDPARVGALRAVLRGAAATPDQAAAVAARACGRDPAHAAEYGESLLGALADAGAFAAAVRFVVQSPVAPLRNEQINTAFDNWAQNDPAAALAGANALSDPALRDDAWRGVTVGWAAADPVGLAKYAAQMPAGERRAQALANALPQWIADDPVTAGTWIAQQDPNPDFDLGVVAVASEPGMIADRPQLALSLAESVADPALRTNTVRTLALQWAERDPAAAIAYVQRTTQLSPDDRRLLLGEMRPPGGG